MPDGYEIAVRYAEALTDKFTLDGPFGGAVYRVDKGRKYHRIVVSNRSGQDRSVHAFVDNIGRLIKPGGWAAPQREKSASGLAVRYDLSTPHGFMEAIDAADWAGSYLYAK